MKLSNLLLPRKSGTIKSPQSLSTSGRGCKWVAEGGGNQATCLGWELSGHGWWPRYPATWDPTAGLCLGSCGSPRGVGHFLGARYPCTNHQEENDPMPSRLREREREGMGWREADRERERERERVCVCDARVAATAPTLMSPPVPTTIFKTCTGKWLKPRPKSGRDSFVWAEIGDQNSTDSRSDEFVLVSKNIELVPMSKNIEFYRESKR